LGPIGKKLRLKKIAPDEKLEGLSHAELVKVAETAAKQALIRGDDRVADDDLAAALVSRRSARRPTKG